MSNVTAKRHRHGGVMLSIYDRDIVVNDREAQELLMDLFNIILGFSPASAPRSEGGRP